MNKEKILVKKTTAAHPKKDIKKAFCPLPMRSRAKHVAGQKATKKKKFLS
jgi:hypothetical protein